jgi:hypothetical protein
VTEQPPQPPEGPPEQSDTGLMRAYREAHPTETGLMRAFRNREVSETGLMRAYRNREVSETGLMRVYRDRQLTDTGLMDQLRERQLTDTGLMPAYRGSRQQNETGLIKQVRNRWRRAATPNQDPQVSYEEKAAHLRLFEANPPKLISERDRRYVLRVFQTMLIVTVVGQRLVIPFGGSPISLALVAAFVGIIFARLRGGVRYNRVRSELYIAAGAGLVLCTWFTSFRGDDVSLNSLLLLLAIYLPWVFCVSSQFADLMVPLLRTFVRVMLFAAVVGAAQMVAQLVLGWKYEDYLATWLPKNLLATGFNTNYQLAWNNPTTKANAFVFLEPSFLCQFCALALLISLLIRAPAWQPLVLGLGMASTLSGTGILLIIVGVVLLIIRVPNRIRPSYVIAAALGLAIVFSTPAANILLDRRTETSQQGSSGYIRFVQPYTEVSKGLSEDSSRLFIGAGPGASDRLLTSSAKGADEAAVVYGIIPKMAFEYGLIAATLFIAFLLLSILRGPPLPVLPTAIAFMIFFLSGSLLQPHTILTAWLLTSIWGPPVTVGVSDALAAALRRPPTAAGPEPIAGHAAVPG